MDEEEVCVWQGGGVFFGLLFFLIGLDKLVIVKLGREAGFMLIIILKILLLHFGGIFKLGFYF